jgi:hypothetical protein
MLDFNRPFLLTANRCVARPLATGWIGQIDGRVDGRAAVSLYVFLWLLLALEWDAKIDG